MELDKSLAVLAAFEKLYCLERNLNESPKDKHPFLNAITQKTKIEDGIRSLKKDKNCLNDKRKEAETHRSSLLLKKEERVGMEKRTPFFRLVLEKMEAEFPPMPDVQEWREV